MEERRRELTAVEVSESSGVGVEVGVGKTRLDRDPL